MKTINDNMSTLGGFERERRVFVDDICRLTVTSSETKSTDTFIRLFSFMRKHVVVFSDVMKVTFGYDRNRGNKSKKGLTMTITPESSFTAATHELIHKKIVNPLFPGEEALLSTAEKAKVAAVFSDVLRNPPVSSTNTVGASNNKPDPKEKDILMEESEPSFVACSDHAMDVVEEHVVPSKSSH